MHRPCPRAAFNLAVVSEIKMIDSHTGQNKMNTKYKNEITSGTSLVVQWVRIHSPNARGPGSIPGQGTRSHMHVTTKSPHTATKKPACCN